MAQHIHATDEPAAGVDLDPTDFQTGTLYWFRVTTDSVRDLDDDPTVKYRPRVVEEIQDDRVCFDTGYYALSDETRSHTGRRFKVTDSGFSYGTVLSVYETAVVPGGRLRITANGQTRTVRVLDSLKGRGERYYVRDEETDTLYYLNGTDGVLSPAGQLHSSHEVADVERVEQGDDVRGTDEPCSLNRFDICRLNRGDRPRVVRSESRFPVARDETAYGVDVSDAVSIADDVLDGRRTQHKSASAIMVSFDPVTDALLTVSVTTSELTTSSSPDEVEESIRTAVQSSGLEQWDDAFETSET